MSTRTTTDGRPADEADLTIDPMTGQQRDYIVLSTEERAKGFVRPVRTSYRHVGVRPRHPLRYLTVEEKERYASENYVAYEPYPPGESSVVGRFWTKTQLESGCGSTTTMGLSLAETYARDPKFYGATFCITCKKHFPVGADGEFTWSGTDYRVGT